MPQAPSFFRRRHEHQFGSGNGAVFCKKNEEKRLLDLEKVLAQGCKTVTNRV